MRVGVRAWGGTRESGERPTVAYEGLQLLQLFGRAKKGGCFP